MSAELTIDDGKVGIRRADKLSTLTVQGKPSFTLTGTVAKTASSTTLTGTGTSFLTEVGIGDVLEVPGTDDEFPTVVAIISNTELTCDLPLEHSASGQTAICHPSIARFEAQDGETKLAIAHNGFVAVGIVTPQVADSEGAHLHIRQATDNFSSIMFSNNDGPGAIAFAATTRDGAQDLNVVVPTSGMTELLTFSPVYGIEVRTGFRFDAIEQVDANYALGKDKSILCVDAGSGGVTVALPAAVDACDGRLYYIYKVAGAGNVTITPDGSDSINGVNASKTISTQWNGIQLIASEIHGWFATVLTAA